MVLITALFSGFQAYLGQLVWPQFHFLQPETAFMDVCRRVGGALLYHAMWIVLIVASFGSGLTGQVGAARILFGMGRDGVLPRRLFAHVNARRSTPDFSLAAIGLVAFGAALILNRGGNGYEVGSEILNAGALIAFMGVNLAAFWQFAQSLETRSPRLARDGEALHRMEDLLCGAIAVLVIKHDDSQDPKALTDKQFDAYIDNVAVLNGHTTEKRRARLRPSHRVGIQEGHDPTPW